MELKRIPNLWPKERGCECADFEWQGRSTNFSVSQSNFEKVKQYIVGHGGSSARLTCGWAAWKFCTPTDNWSE